MHTYAYDSMFYKFGIMCRTIVDPTILPNGAGPFFLGSAQTTALYLYNNLNKQLTCNTTYDEPQRNMNNINNNNTTYSESPRMGPPD